MPFAAIAASIPSWHCSAPAPVSPWPPPTEKVPPTMPTIASYSQSVSITRSMKIFMRWCMLRWRVGVPRIRPSNGAMSAGDTSVPVSSRRTVNSTPSTERTPSATLSAICRVELLSVV